MHGEISLSLDSAPELPSDVFIRRMPGVSCTRRLTPIIAADHTPSPSSRAGLLWPSEDIVRVQDLDPRDVVGPNELLDVLRLDLEGEAVAVGTGEEAGVAEDQALAIHQIDCDLPAMPYVCGRYRCSEAPHDWLRLHVYGS